MKSESIGNSLDFSKLTCYVINLASRKDRLQSALPQLKKLDMNHKIEIAIDAKNLKSDNPFISRATEACYKSHFNVIAQIARGAEDYGFILEDDFLITNFNKLNEQFRRIDFKDYDLIQFGWLQNTLRDRILIALTTLEGRLFHSIYLFAQNVTSLVQKIGRRLRIVRNSTIYSRWLVQDDFKSGGHFYLLSKNFARKLIEFNPEAQVPIDNFFATIAATRRFRIARTTKSFVIQTNSPSSIKNT